MKRAVFIGLFLLLALASCHDPRRQARQMVRRAESLFDTMPYSTASLIDSVLRMPVYFEEKHGPLAGRGLVWRPRAGDTPVLPNLQFGSRETSICNVGQTRQQHFF